VHARGLRRRARRLPPLRHAPRLAPLITAIGVSIILQHLALLVWSRNFIAFPQIIELKLFHFGRASRARPSPTCRSRSSSTSVVMMAGLLALVYRTKIGIAMRATSQNPQIAGLMGVDIDRVISFTFVIGAALGAVAGVMVGTYYGIAHYQMGFPAGTQCLSAGARGAGGLAGASATSRGAVLGRHSSWPHRRASARASPGRPGHRTTCASSTSGCPGFR
jgi:branched-chain amino acid transport system permease protein